MVRRLPARLIAEDAATLLGFKSHDIPALVRAGILKPLGGGPKNCVKYFSTRQVELVAGDDRLLEKASKIVLRCRNAKAAMAAHQEPAPLSATH